ncbi:phage tail protein [Gorillibacterium sp. sgz5001074]|uniref:phage tail protein n=1 Tax=Gorillibacterium sp. sgz5001074 TaxID=3446695 RepID=UPI003F67787A
MGTIKVDTSQLNRVMKGLAGLEKQAPKAFMSALNRTLDHVYSKTGRIVTKHYNVSAREIKQSMSKNRATYSRPKAWILVRSRRFTLGRFLPGGLGSKSKVAKVKIKKGPGYKKVGGKPGAFVQKATGNTHVFRRTGKGRYPVEMLRTISPTQMIENLDVAEEIQTAGSQMLLKRLEHEIDYRLKKAGGK